MKTHIILFSIILLPFFLWGQTTVVTGKSAPKKVVVSRQRGVKTEPVTEVKKEVKGITKIKDLPDLIITNEQFVDVNGNNIIDAGERNAIKFNVQNIGIGSALKVQVKAGLKNPVAGILFNPLVDLGDISPEGIKEVSLPVISGVTLENGLAEFKIEVIEDRGLDAFPLEMKVETQGFLPPDVLVTDAAFSTDDGGVIKLNYPITLKVIVQNIGRGTASDVNATFSFVNDNCLLLGDAEAFNLGVLNKGESKQLEFLFTANRRYTMNQIPIKIHLTERLGKYAKDTVVAVGLDQKLMAKSEVVIQGVKTIDSNITLASLSSDVDKNIPENSIKYPNRFALIIGNEDYNKYQSGINTEMNVAFARNDANIFKEYVVKTFGLPENNVLFLKDATTGEMNQKIDLVSKFAAKAGDSSEIIFYYAGHGLPDENTKIPYLIPVDVSGTNISMAIKLSDVYKKLTESGARKVSVFLDACFSGGGRESGLLAARSIKVKPKDDMLTGKIVVFSASSGEQSALPYSEKQHGIFTYFLLKKLQESHGDVTYGEMANYVKKQVSLESLKINQKEQDPVVNISADVSTNWEKWIVK